MVVPICPDLSRCDQTFSRFSPDGPDSSRFVKALRQSGHVGTNREDRDPIGMNRYCIGTNRDGPLAWGSRFSRVRPSESLCATTFCRFSPDGPDSSRFVKALHNRDTSGQIGRPRACAFVPFVVAPAGRDREVIRCCWRQTSRQIVPRGRANHSSCGSQC